MVSKLIIACCLTAPKIFAEPTLLFNIERQSADKALVTFAKQAKITLLFPQNKAQQITIGPLQGRYSLRQALQILLADSPIRAEVQSSPTGNGDTAQARLLVNIDFSTASAAAPPAPVQTSAKLIEEVITIGSRDRRRKASELPSPVTQIKGEQLRALGPGTTGELLRYLLPALNLAEHPISDATTLIRPMNLRALPQDHMLLLVNGKRRHRSSVITWQGNGVSDGAQGPDLTSIPIAAIDSIEILSDGAASQYGSDAIAGVINIRLREASQGGSVAGHYGVFRDGGETSVNLSTNKGFAIKDGGFVHLAADYRQMQPTDRSVARKDVEQLLADGYQDVPQPAMAWGSPEVSDDTKLFANFEWPLSTSQHIFGYANSSQKTSEGSFYYRHPTRRQGVYGDGHFLLVGALDGNRDACPQIPLSGNIPEAQSFARVLQDANCFTFQEIIRGGFTPRFGADIQDRSLLLGLGHDAEKLNLEFSAYYGFHKTNFFVKNTVNASMGPDTPRDFDPGAYRQVEFNLNGDMNYPLSDNFNIAAGVERREETFSVLPGEANSYIDGGLADQGFSSGANGFVGFSPAMSGRWQRTNYAMYWEMAHQSRQRHLFTLATRSEYFEGFGHTTNIKLGGNWRLTPHWRARTSLSTGFKAPTPGQVNTVNFTTMIVGSELVDRITLPSTSTLARDYGGKALEPERSKNLSLGTHLEFEHAALAIDFFRIAIADRLNLSAPQKLNDAQRDILQREGLSPLQQASEFRFFINDFNTVTSGFDLSGKLKTAHLWGQTEYSLNYNYTKTVVSPFNSQSMTARRRRLLEQAFPRSRWRFIMQQRWRQHTLMLRTHYFGPYYDDESLGVFRETLLFDIEFDYRLNKQINLYMGINNLFDEKGCTVDQCSELSSETLGQLYSQYSPSGFNGTQWYWKFNYRY